MASHLILLDTPCELHIPYFAMPLPASRENEIARLNIDSDLIKIVGRRCAAWIKARLEHDKIELVQTRDYVPPRTAFYSKWLLFRNEAAAAAFLDSWPRYSLDERLTKIGEERVALASTLERRLKRGDFDLGHIGDEQQRENLAHRYTEIAKTLRGLRSQLSLLETAKGLAEKWQAAL